MCTLLVNNEHKGIDIALHLSLIYGTKGKCGMDGLRADSVSAQEDGCGGKAFVAVFSCERRENVKWKDRLGRNGERVKECTTSQREQLKSLMGRNDHIVIMNGREED